MQQTQEAASLEVEIAVGNESQILSVFANSKVLDLVKQFSKQNKLSSADERKLYEQLDELYQESFMDDDE